MGVRRARRSSAEYSHRNCAPNRQDARTCPVCALIRAVVLVTRRRTHRLPSSARRLYVEAASRRSASRHSVRMSDNRA